MSNWHDPKRENLTLESWAADPIVKEWILAAELNSRHVEWADDLGQALATEKMTPTSLRNFFDEVRSIQAKGFAKSKQRFLLLRPKLAYFRAKAMGERGATKDKGFHKFAQVMTMAHAAVDMTKPEHFERYVELMEAVLAYHKYYDLINSRKSTQNYNDRA